MVTRLLTVRTPSRPLAALLGVALALLCGACGSSGASHGPTSHQRTASLISMFEAQGQLLRDPTTALRQLGELGVDSVRVFVPWASIAPNKLSPVAPAGFQAASSGAYGAAVWAPYDGIVRAAAARHVIVDLTLEGPPPLWASGPGMPHGVHPQWRPNAAQYGNFVHAVAARYSGHFVPAPGSPPLPRVSMWSIWNEPNYGPQLAPQAIDHSTVEVAPAIYRGLLDAAWSALNATGHGADTVLLGEFAPRGLTTGDNPGNFSGMVPLRFLRALYCVDGSLHPLQGSAAAVRGCPVSGTATGFIAAHPALFHAAGYALHLYPLGSVPPNVSSADEPDYADLATVGRFERTLDRMVSAYGSGMRFLVYDTEFGFKTNPPFSAGAPPARAAEYLNWGEYLHWRDPRIRSYDQYLLTDPVGHSDFATGLEYADGTPKPTLAAFRMPLYLPVTSAGHGAPLEVWGGVRPADLASGTSAPARASLQFAPAGSHSFRDLRAIPVTDAGGYFDLAVTFPGSGSVRIAWTPAGGPVLLSRTVAITIH